MLVYLQELSLIGLRAFYDLPWQVGLFTLGSIGIVLVGVQYLKKRTTFLPGMFGLIFLVGAVGHVTRDPRIPNFFERILTEVQTPDYEHLPFSDFPLASMVESLFAFFVGSPEYRNWFDEGLFSGLLAYLCCVAYVSFREYKKTGLVLGSFSFSFEPTVKRPTRSKTNELGSGDLASTEQISRWLKPSAKGKDTILHVKELRGSEGVAFRHSKIVIPSGERNRHILCVAKTGGGKTTKMILPILYNDCLDPDRSTIVLDSKPEMWRKLAGMTRKFNPKKKILLFNPLDKVRSLSWNILGKIEDDTDCKLIANTIIMATDQPQSKSDSPFFRTNALSLLNSIMIGLLGDENETLSMPRIHELVQSGMKPLCDWLEKHPEAYRNTRTFVELARSGSQNADTIMSELGMRLSAWDLATVRATTAQLELDLETLIAEPTLFIIELRESELEMLRPLANVIVVEILRFLTKRAESCPGSCLPRPVGLVIDEFASSLGRLPDIHVKLNTLRSRNVSIVAAIQSIAQIKANYSDDADSVLAGFSTKILMPMLDVQDAEWGSKETGQMTVRFKTASAGSNRKIIEWFASKNEGTQEQVQQRAVLTPDEIGRPVDNINTFFFPNTPVFQGHLIPYYEIPEMLKRIQEFDSPEHELKLREAPIEYVDTPPNKSGALPNGAAGASGAPAGGGAGHGYPYDPFATPPGISNTAGWNDTQINDKLTEVKKKLDWDNTTGSARKWWEAFESENKTRMALVLRLAEELAVRNATITEFFLAYVYSNTDNIQANLCYLDYTRLKKDEEKKKREAAQASGAESSDIGSDFMV
jgi:type IV secretory pathway TraG/TraD family ATPase VirD4